MSEEISIEIEPIGSTEEIHEDKPRKRKSNRGGKRVGAGRPVKAEQKKPILTQSKKARSQEVLAEMLGKKSKYVVQKVLDKALNDEDEDQMACLKIVMDRVLPADYLAKMKNKSNNIQIQIMGVGETVISSNEEPIDGDFEEIEDGE
jgi:hypothetical protein